MSPHVIERLSAFLDGELPEAERREVQAHLESCPSCKTRLAELAVLDEAARGLEVQAPDGYFEALPGRVRLRLRGGRRASMPVWGWAAAAALLIAVLLPKLSYEPSAPKPAPAARVPAAPPPTSVAAARELAPEAAASGSLKSSAPATTGRRDEPRPGGRLARDEAKTEAAPAPMEEGYVTPPASAAVPQTTTPTAPEERVVAEAEQRKPSAPDRSAPLASGAVSKERRKQAFEAKGLADAKEKDALRPAPRSAQEARALRESCRERARRHPEGAEGDVARLQIVEAGARAYELGGDPRDLAVLRQDAEAYLARRDARHPDRVRELLRSLEENP